MARRNWTEEELILVINLYHKLPFGRMHRSNSAVVQLASVLDRTPSAVAMKLTNFASFDPELQARGIKGMSNAGKLDRIVWNRFYSSLEDSIYQSEEELAKYNLSYGLGDDESAPISYIGYDKEAIRKVRVGQSFFRNSLLAAYDETCCITGLKNRELVVASHIIGWADDPNYRLDPRNGLILNALHDKAFDRGLLTVTPDYRIKLSEELREKEHSNNSGWFLPYDNEPIRLPNKLFPSRDFLARHSEVTFRGG